MKFQIRPTSFSTPLFGLSWEYRDEERRIHDDAVQLEQKIRVFISSICDQERYLTARASLKRCLQRNPLIAVYLFEDDGASTMSAEASYINELLASDVCIIFIDNADGISSGVQKEIDAVRESNKPALYYFCDERSHEKTTLQKELTGGQQPRYKVVHSFDEFVNSAAVDLPNDVINRYRMSRTNPNLPAAKIMEETNSVSQETMLTLSPEGISITSNSRAQEKENAADVINVITSDVQYTIVSKGTLESLDKTRVYFLKFIFGERRYGNEKINKTCELDEWCEQFLPILFEGKSIKSFNTELFMEMLQPIQSKEFHELVRIRWKAIQAYFGSDIHKCVECLEEALNKAKDTNQPIWVVKDILIDLRNMQWMVCFIDNKFTEPSALEELDESDETVYYPVLDRMGSSLQEKCLDSIIEEAGRSPYTVTLVANYSQYGDLLAQCFAIPMFNGSLTQLLIIYKRVRMFLFMLCSKYDDRLFRLNLFKLVIRDGKDRDIRKYHNAYPELLQGLTSEEAVEIIEFCKNQPIGYQRFSCQLLAFGEVGCYLADADFRVFEKYIVDSIFEWLDDDQGVMTIGQSIFKGLSGVAYRMSQDTLAAICIRFIDRHYVRFYMEMFRFMQQYIDLRKMSDETAQALVNHILGIFENDNERKQIEYAPHFLYVIRKQNRALTEGFDEKVEEYFPGFYEKAYRLEITETVQQDFPELINRYISDIKEDNKKQVVGGTYYGHFTREHATMRAMLLDDEFTCSAEQLKDILSVAVDTLVNSKEDVSTKLDAISLILCVSVKYPKVMDEQRDLLESLYDSGTDIHGNGVLFMISNMDDIALKIGMQLIYTILGKDTSCELIEYMSEFQGDMATIIGVARLFVQYLEVADSVMLSEQIETIVLQNALQWIHSKNLDVRWYAIKLLFLMLRQEKNRRLINDQIRKIVDMDCVNIKNLILRKISGEGVTEETRRYVLEKCQNDANYLVRMVCQEEIEKNGYGA